MQITNRSNQVSVPVAPGDAVSAALPFTQATASFARPNDAAPYAALDNVANSVGAPTILNFANLAKVNGGGGYIVKARILTDQKTCVARFRLHLYKTAVAAQGDNTPFTLLWVNNATRIGYIEWYGMKTEDPANSTAAGDIDSSGDNNLPLEFICDPADRDLYGMLETLDAFTPANNQNFFIELSAE